MKYLSSLLALTGSLLALGCDPDEEEEYIEQCLAAPSCAPDQMEVPSCEEDDPACQAISRCDLTIYCTTSDLQCDAVPVCPENSIEVPSCEEAEGDCTEESICGATIYCEQSEINCSAMPTCEPGTDEVESCEGIEDHCNSASLCGVTIYCAEQHECDTVFECTPDSVQVDGCDPDNPNCYEVSDCGQTIYCEAVEVSCDAVPSCQDGEAGSLNPCQDNGETCRSEEVCGSTIYCRPVDDIEIIACEAPSPEAEDEPEQEGVESLRIEGDRLLFDVAYSGGCVEHTFPGCFTQFQESNPVQTQIIISHVSEEDVCRGYFEEERSIDLSPLKAAYMESYRTDTGTIILKVVGSSTTLDYSF